MNEFGIDEEINQQKSERKKSEKLDLKNFDERDI